jgi:organic radical activating enzyme
MNDTWCVLPWTHVCVRTDMALKPCCRFLSENPTNEFDVTLEDLSKNGIAAMNSDLFTDIRAKMLAGEQLPGCKKCYSQEADLKSNKRSMRQYFNNEFKIDRTKCTEQFESVRYIEMSIDNICNLQCRICDSKFSSKLQNRDAYLGKQVFKKLEPNFNKFDAVDLSNLEHIKILGGEPFITPNFEKFVDYIIERSKPSDVLLNIATNGTSTPSNSIIEKLKQFKAIYINVSLDSVTRSNDYQRFGSKYDKTLEIAESYEKLMPNSTVSYHVTVSVYTAGALAKTISHFENINRLYSVDFVRHPPHLSLLYTPKNYNDWVLEQNQDHSVAFGLLTNIFKENQYNIKYWGEFLDFTKKLDNYYGIRLTDYDLNLYEFLSKNYHFGD